MPHRNRPALPARDRRRREVDDCREALRRAGLSGQPTLARLLALLRAAPETHLGLAEVVRMAAEAGLAATPVGLARQLETLADYGLLGRLPTRRPNLSSTPCPSRTPTWSTSRRLRSSISTSRRRRCSRSSVRRWPSAPTGSRSWSVSGRIPRRGGIRPRNSYLQSRVSSETNAPWGGIGSNAAPACSLQPPRTYWPGVTPGRSGRRS